MWGYPLYIIASVLSWILHPIAYIYGYIVSVIKHEGSAWHKQLAISKDQHGNCLCKYLFNSLLITKLGYRFGNIDETISSVIGKNKRNATLTKLGLLVDHYLSEAEEDHSLKSIDEDEN